MRNSGNKNKTILSPQYSKIDRYTDLNAELWIDMLRSKVTECKYRDSCKTNEQFINGIYDHSNSINNRELIVMEITSEQILPWAKRI